MSDKKYMIDNKFVKIPIKNITPNSYNNNVFDLDTFEKLKKSILTDGFTVPILVIQTDENKYEIVDGEHRYKAMKELGEEYITCVVKTEEEMTEVDMKKSTLAYNRLRGKGDFYKTALLIQDMVCDYGEEGVSAIMDAGFSDIEIKTFTQSLEEDSDDLSTLLSKEFKQEPDEGRVYKKTEIKKRIKSQETYKLGNNYISFSNPHRTNALKSLIKDTDKIDMFILNVPVDDLKMDSNIFLWLKPILDKMFDYLDGSGVIIVKAPLKKDSKTGNIIDYSGDMIQYLTQNLKMNFTASIVEIDNASNNKKGIKHYHTSYYMFSFLENFQINKLEYDVSAEIRSVTGNYEDFINIFSTREVETTFIYNIIKHFFSSSGKVVEFYVSDNTVKACFDFNKVYIGIDNHPIAIDSAITQWETLSNKKREVISIK